MLHDCAICVAGPPGAGKTTVVTGLREVLGGSVFRLGDEIRKRPELVIADRDDPLGWVDDASVARVLDAASDLLAAGPHPILLDNFPGRLGQLDVLSQLADRLGLGCGVLELVADDRILHARLADRRVCPRCQPDLHTPARVSSDVASSCAACGSPVLRRASDRADVCSLRLGRYRTNLAGLQDHARDLGLSYARVDAGRAAAVVRQDTRKAIFHIARNWAGNSSTGPGAVMAVTHIPLSNLRLDRGAVTDAYGHARLPASSRDIQIERVDNIPYGRFRNVYLYITESCQLRCEHCYMGERLERALKMPYETVMRTLTTWRQMGGSKLTILGGEPTLHPDYIDIIRGAKKLGYEHVITTSNGLKSAARKFNRMEPDDFSYVQISLDGGSAASHDQVRGAGTFDEALATIAELCRRGFDTRIICTVNRVNLDDCLNLLDIADELGVSLTKFHVFSVIGSGHGAAEWGIQPREWIEFYEHLEVEARGHRTRVWYQPTYARRERLAGYAASGYRGCIGRTLDRISIFPDGRAYVCSFLFDTELHFAQMVNGKVVLNKGDNEFDLFTGVLRNASCGSCKDGASCMGGCPAEELVMGTASCATDPDILPVCRLWKADMPTVTG